MLIACMEEFGKLGTHLLPWICNPVYEGIVNHAYEWRYSSASNYQGQEVLLRELIFALDYKSNTAESIQQQNTHINTNQDQKQL